MTEPANIAARVSAAIACSKLTPKFQSDPTSFETASFSQLALLAAAQPALEKPHAICQMVNVAKRAWLSRTLGANPLNEPGIVQQVLSYAGAGQRLFCAGVSSLWLDVYETVNGEKATSTSTSAIFASASRLCWAYTCQSGLLASTMLAAHWRIAGRAADSDTLAVAHELFPVVDKKKALAHGAAEAGSLQALVWLHSKHSSSCTKLPRADTDCIFDEQVIVAAAGAGLCMC
jgi:hypothetical protein